jgi:hypothetical protein
LAALLGLTEVYFFVGPSFTYTDDAPPSSFVSSLSAINFTDFPFALSARWDFKLDFGRIVLALWRFSYPPTLELSALTSILAIAPSGKAIHAYSANQSDALGGLNRICFGNVIAVNAMSEVYTPYNAIDD